MLLAGCAGMGPQIDGWPELAVYEHHVSQAEVRDRCRQYSRFALSCAEVNFAQGRCDVWLSGSSSYVRRHELLHCAGHDHEDDDTLGAAHRRHRELFALQL